MIPKSEDSAYYPMENRAQRLHNFSRHASCLRIVASIFQIKQTVPGKNSNYMKSLLCISALLLTTALWLPRSHAQTAPQDSQGPRYGRGMGIAEMQAHSVRGDITALSGNTITVKTEEGEVYSIATGPNTHFRKERDQIQISDLHVGDMIAAMGDKDPKARTLGAVFVVVIDKARYEQMRADFGKTWTAGVVQAINGTNITIKRPDKAIQTIAVDENTSFRRRREDITLPDIKLGDNISARGALQNGSFLATMVVVGPAGAYRRDRGAGPGQPAQPNN